MNSTTRRLCWHLKPAPPWRQTHLSAHEMLWTSSRPSPCEDGLVRTKGVIDSILRSHDSQVSQSPDKISTTRGRGRLATYEAAEVRRTTDDRNPVWTHLAPLDRYLAVTLVRCDDGISCRESAAPRLVSSIESAICYCGKRDWNSSGASRGDRRRTANQSAAEPMRPGTEGPVDCKPVRRRRCLHGRPE